MPKEAAEIRAQAEPEVPEVPQYQETYSQVVFAEKSNPADPDNVILAVNGEQLIIQRGTPVIVPGRFLECADHAFYYRYVQLPDQPRKIAAVIKSFPYTVIRRDCTEQEYLKAKKAGDEVTVAEMKRIGALQ